MDFDKTVQPYEKIGQAKAWKQVPERHRHEKEKSWYDKVKSKGLVNAFRGRLDKARSCSFRLTAAPC